MPIAAIFDLDGTLLDSVDLHALAWHEAMKKFGHDVSFEEARGQIGKGGDKLIPHFLSEDAQRDHGKELEAWRGKRFKSEYLGLDGRKNPAHKPSAKTKKPPAPADKATERKGRSSVRASAAASEHEQAK